MISDEAKIKPIVPKIVNIKKKNDVLILQYDGIQMNNEKNIAIDKDS